MTKAKTAKAVTYKAWGVMLRGDDGREVIDTWADSGKPRIIETRDEARGYIRYIRYLRGSGLLGPDGKFKSARVVRLRVRAAVEG